MCGIAGATGVIDDEVVQAVERMQAALTHRGPDAEGIWRGEHTVLAHRRLSILDLTEAGIQPMHDDERGVHLSYNGEIYNFRELAAELAASGEQVRSRSDTEVLLRLIAARGLRGALEELRGMFAFAALVEDRDDQSAGDVLHLVRDRLGVKPLYYCHLDDVGPGGRPTVLFASELRALLASGLIERHLDPEALRTFVWNGFVVDPHSAICGVRSLPPGHRLELHPKAIAEGGRVPGPQRWWSLPHSLTRPRAEEALADELERAVRSRLVSDVPLGVFLSGGIDSSSVAALAAREGTRLSTFCIAFPDAVGDEARAEGDVSQRDESGFAQQVADAIGTDHTTIPLDEAGFSGQLGQALDALDQPTFDGINTWFVSRAVKDAGLTVALAGTGGDELFGGYTTFKDLPRAERVAAGLERVPLMALQAAATAVTRLKSGPFGEVPPQTRYGKLGDVLGSRGHRTRLYQCSYALFTRAYAAELRGKDDERWGLTDQLLHDLDELTSDEQPLHAVTQLELSLFLGNRLLRDTDAASMASSLEVRVPLIDHLVVEAAAGVRPDRRMAPVGSKALLRKLALRDLEPALFDRPKSGFEMPFDVWCRRGLKGELEAVLTDAPTLRSLGLDPDAVGRLWRSYIQGAPGIYWSRVWALFVLCRWCAAHQVALR